MLIGWFEMTAIPGPGFALSKPAGVGAGATDHAGLRRIGSQVALAAGCLALALAVLLPTYVYHHVAVLPDDPQTEQDQVATDATALVPDVQIPAGAQVMHNVVARITTYIAEAPGGSKKGSVVWQLATTTNIDGQGLLDARVETISLDRQTAEPTNCCGDKLVTSQEDPKGVPLHHQGYLTFPFNVQKHSYPVWDVQLNRERPATYQGEERRDGFRTYRFRASNEWTKIGTQEVPGALFGLSAPSVVADSEYADTRTYWIEPASGSVVGLHENLQQRLTYQGHSVTALSADLDSPRLSGDILQQTRSGARWLPWLRGRASIVLVLLGLALIGLWAFVTFAPAGRRFTNRPGGGSAERTEFAEQPTVPFPERPVPERPADHGPDQTTESENSR
jgi:hypothetical protein